MSSAVFCLPLACYSLSMNSQRVINFTLHGISFILFYKNQIARKIINRTSSRWKNYFQCTIIYYKMSDFEEELSDHAHSPVQTLQNKVVLLRTPKDYETLCEYITAFTQLDISALEPNVISEYISNAISGPLCAEILNSLSEGSLEICMH